MQISGRNSRFDFSRFDSNDRKELYLAWNDAHRKPGEQLVPSILKAFSEIKKAPGRECLLFLLSGFARYFSEAKTILRASVSDRSQKVQTRSRNLSKYLAARKAIFADADDSEFWFFFPALKGRDPRGSFADRILSRYGSQLKKFGYQCSYSFAHEARFFSGKRLLRFVWDSNDCKMFIHKGIVSNPMGERARAFANESTLNIKEIVSQNV